MQGQKGQNRPEGWCAIHPSIDHHERTVNGRSSNGTERNGTERNGAIRPDQPKTGIETHSGARDRGSTLEGLTPTFDPAQCSSGTIGQAGGDGPGFNSPFGTSSHPGRSSRVEVSSRPSTPGTCKHPSHESEKTENLRIYRHPPQAWYPKGTIKRSSLEREPPLIREEPPHHGSSVLPPPASHHG